LTPHRSHQAGRDVDINYYLRGDQKWYSHTNAQNIDLARCWALVKTFMNETDVDMIFIDTSIQRLLADYAVSVGEDAAWIDSLFQVRGKNWAAKIRHVRGHATHLHVRFFSPLAQEMGRRAERYLPASVRPVAVAAKTTNPGKGGAHASNDGHGRRGDKGHGDKTDKSHESEKSEKGDKGGNIAASSHFVMHRARSGDVLVNLAKHYNTTPEAIQQANGMKGNALQIGHTYKIPVNSQAPAVHPPRHSGTLSRVIASRGALASYASWLTRFAPSSREARWPNESYRPRDRGIARAKGSHGPRDRTGGFLNPPVPDGPVRSSMGPLYSWGRFILGPAQALGAISCTDRSGTGFRLGSCCR
jgi:LysM repeat protein